MKSARSGMKRSFIFCLSWMVLALAQAKEKSDLPVPILPEGVEDRYLIESGIVTKPTPDAVQVDQDDQQKVSCDVLPQLTIMATRLAP
jgi:hypothetical protein